jgi:flagellar M-ring protein FliF
VVSMNQRLNEMKEKISGFWGRLSKKKKWGYVGIFLFLVLSLSLGIYFFSKPQLVPLYANSLSQKEVGDIKTELERQGYTDFQLADNGTKILVPKQDAPDLLVNLAAKGLPKTGAISFGEMTQNAKFGITDREFDAMEREVIQGQVAELITHIDGIKNANVMITLPEDTPFLRPDEKSTASASVIVEMEPGYTLEPGQIRALYHLVSKSIPNLPKENIAIMDQYSQLLDDQTDDSDGLDMQAYEKQRKIQQDVERDITRNLQSMLGTIMGTDKVLVQAFVKLNFDQVKTKEQLVEPVNKESNEGIAVSVEKITKSYKGQGSADGTDGTGETDVPGYPAEGSGESSESEELQNRVNYEVNRITKEIIQSPYSIEDVTINVGVEPPNPKKPSSLTPQMEQNIKDILSNVVSTALADKKNLTQRDINNRITVFPKEFAGKQQIQQTKEEPNYLVYGIGALTLIIIGVSLFLLLRKKNKLQYQEELDLSRMESLQEFAPIEEEAVIIRQELEDIIQKNPDDFVALLRYWINEEKKED